MDIFNPTDIRGEKAVRRYSGEVKDFLEEIQSRSLRGPINHCLRTVELACITAERGNRGVGAVMVHKRDGIVGEGRNTVKEPGNDWMHVSHAEINAIRSFNKRMLTRAVRKLPDTELISSIGPCAMCMGSALTRQVPKVTTLHPDSTGGVALDDMVRMFPGWMVHVREGGMHYGMANLTDYPDDLGRKIGRLAWAISRVSAYKFNRKEFELGVEDGQASDRVEIR